MKLVVADFLEKRQIFLFHTESEEIVMTVNWSNEYIPTKMRWIDTPKTTEEIIRQNIQQIGFYTDDTDFVFRLNTLLPKYIEHYKLPLSFQSIPLPNRELMLISVVNRYDIANVKELVFAIVSATCSASPLEAQPEVVEDEHEFEEESVIVMDDAIEEVEEETPENRELFSIGEVVE